MTGRLPSLKPREVMRALERGGFVMVRSKGSHRIFEHPSDPGRRTVVADHGARDVPRGTLRDIIDQAGFTVDEFLALLRRIERKTMIPTSALQKTAEALMAKVGNFSF